MCKEHGSLPSTTGAGGQTPRASGALPLAPHIGSPRKEFSAMTDSTSRRRMLQAGAGVALAGALLLPDRPRTATAQPAGPIEPGASGWKPWLLTSGDQFRPPPPDSSATAAEVSQLKTMAG